MLPQPRRLGGPTGRHLNSPAQRVGKATFLCRLLPVKLPQFPFDGGLPLEKHRSVWNSCKCWLLGLLCVVLIATSGLIAVRHRHSGDPFHSHARDVPEPSGHSHPHRHSHSHSHGHSHGHGHSHAHPHAVHHSETPDALAASNGLQRQYEGWHLHLFLLGYEITLWERGLEIARGPSSNTEASSNIPVGTMVLRGLEILTPGGQIGSVIVFAWLMLYVLFRRVACPAGDFSGEVVLASYTLQCGRERPPLPPPRTTQTQFIRIECC